MFFIIKFPTNDQEKYTIIFCCRGYRKLYPKALALEEQAPKLEKFTAQAFVKPYQDVTKYKNGTDEPLEFDGYEIKISEIKMALEDYDIAKKQLKINIYLPYFNEIKENKNLENEIHLIVMFILGEIAFYKHIQEINLHQMPREPIGLLSLIELPYFIDYLYKINSRKKTSII